MILTSINNPRIKEVKNLRESVARRASGFFIIEGCRELSLALEAGIAITSFYFCPEFLGNDIHGQLLARIRNTKVAIFEVSKQVYEKIAYGNRREGLLAVAKRPHLNLSETRCKAVPFVVIAEHIEKPGNLGALVRTADGAGADMVIAADSVTDTYNPNAVRSSRGAVFTIPVVNTSSEEALRWLKKNNIKIIAALIEAETVYTDIDFKKPFAIVLGSEDKGLSALWKDNADYRVRIPMAGKADSLNVSASAAIVLFEAVRQRSI